MCYPPQPPGQQAQSDEPFLPVAEAIIFEGDARPGKHLFGILEAEAMLGDVFPVLRLVPFVFHSSFKVDCSSFCSYTQGGWPVLSRSEGRARPNHCPEVKCCPILS